MSKPRINAPDEITLPPGMGGTSQATWDSVSFWNTRGITVDDLDGGRSEILVDRYLLPLSGVDQWCALGSEVFDYEVWHEIDDITTLCPYSVDTGEPGWVQETWETWGTVGASHKPIEIDGKWYRSNLYGVAGTRLEATKWHAYITTPDRLTTAIIRMLTVEEFDEIRSAAEGTIAVKNRARDWARRWDQIIVGPVGPF